MLNFIPDPPAHLEQTPVFNWAEAIAKADNPFIPCMTRYHRAPIAFVREVLGAEPDPWQAEALRALARGHTRLSIRSGHGVGKAHGYSMLLDTPDGPRRWGDLQPGDRLFGRDGEPTHITMRHEQGCKPLYRVTFDDGTSTRVTAEHLWTVRGRQQRRHGSDTFVTIDTAEIMRRGVRALNGKTSLRQWELPPILSVQYPAQHVPIAPYLLGATLADGHLSRDNGNLTLAGSAEKVQAWEAEGHANGISTTITKVGKQHENVWAIRFAGQREGLRRLGLAAIAGNERFVPDCYKANLAAVRLAVLQGLMDGDGSCSRTGHSHFDSISLRLVEDVVWLVRSLGGKAIVRGPYATHYSPHGVRVRMQDQWRATVRLPAGMDLFTLPSKLTRIRPDIANRFIRRHIDSIEPDGVEQAMCVTVDAADGLYLANDFIVTHNTCFAAWCVVWFMNTRAPFKCAITAPTAPQLYDALYPEVLGWHRKLPELWRNLWDATSDHIKLKSDPESFVTARTARPEQPEALQGIHSDHILLVCDEASGIAEPIFEAAAGSMSSVGATTILIGNPVRSSGFFWRTQNTERGRWFTMRVNGIDSPRVTKSFTEEMAQRYGIDSNAYRIRVLGEFPNADSDTFISAELVDQAMQRDVPLDTTKPEIWGLDVARFGDDASVLIKRRGYVVTEMPRVWQGFDTMQLAGAIKYEYDLSVGSKPQLICVDAIGIGAGVADRLLEQGLPVLCVNVGEAPSTTGRYVRLRDEAWGTGRQWLESRACRLPRDEQLRDELVAPRYSFTSDGRIQIESKQQMRTRGLRSPDRADAFLLSLLDKGMGVTSASDGWLYSQTPVRQSIPGME